jgi:hypothetical protein
VTEKSKISKTKEEIYKKLQHLEKKLLAAMKMLKRMHNKNSSSMVNKLIMMTKLRA